MVLGIVSANKHDTLLNSSSTLNKIKSYFLKNLKNS